MLRSVLAVDPVLEVTLVAGPVDDAGARLRPPGSRSAVVAGAGAGEGHAAGRGCCPATVLFNWFRVGSVRTSPFRPLKRPGRSGCRGADLLPPRCLGSVVRPCRRWSASRLKRDCSGRVKSARSTANHACTSGLRQERRRALPRFPEAADEDVRPRQSPDWSGEHCHAHRNGAISSGAGAAEITSGTTPMM